MSSLRFCQGFWPKKIAKTYHSRRYIDILAAVKRTAIPHHATFLGWSLNGVDASPKNA
ncbi:hypothetical protein [Microcystis aeruginosa]|uniref:hypothetical protein n=1 Tax=Microcystis aeruginosa TaxID=1126 RepID=UPI00147CADDA|nr:hypothetical protein [Microcystis aeruginosa]